jgi:hypothetical protein
VGRNGSSVERRADKEDNGSNEDIRQEKRREERIRERNEGRGGEERGEEGVVGRV